MYTAARTIDVETYPEATYPDEDNNATDSGETGEGISIGADRFDVTKHNATLTLVSPRTGEHRTFRIRTKKSGALKGKRVVELLVGPSNTEDYEGFAFADPFGVKVWSKKKGQNGEQSLYDKYADMLERPSYWAAKGVEYLASLRCTRCGRPLTHPESIASGMGPICEGRE